jgi:hypothetical protein
MAYNPFTWFRKHKKVLFSGLILVCMLTFVASFGQGDVVQKALAIIGARRGGGEVVATLHGQKITIGDLQLLQRRRETANQFMTGVVATPFAYESTLRALRDQDLKADAASPDNLLTQLRTVLAGIEQRDQDRQRLNQNLTFLRDPQLAQMFLRDFVNRFRQSQQNDIRTLQAIASRPGILDDKASVQTLDKVAILMGYQTWLASSRTGWYFGGSNEYDDLLDFVMWKQQADKLGIHLTRGDVINELNREGFHRNLFDEKSFERDDKVLRFLQPSGNRNERGIRPQDLIEILADEFRVSMAQGILLGREPGARAGRTRMTTPGTVTPDQFLEYFREQRTLLKVELLPVPVQKYVGEVKGVPSEIELRNLFSHYRDQEPQPDRREPGFKEPRRFAIEYVSANPESPWYRQKASRIRRHIELLADPLVASRWRLAAPASIAPAGTGPLGWLAQVTVPISLDPLQSLYEERVGRLSSWWSSDDEGIFSDEKLKRLHNTSIHRWDTFVPMLGSLTGSVQGGGNAWTAAATLYANSTYHEVAGSLRFASTILLRQGGMALYTNGLAHAVGTAALATPLQVPAPSLESVRETLLAGLEESERERLVREELQIVKKKIAELKSKPAEVDAWLKTHLRDPDVVDKGEAIAPKGTTEKDETVHAKHQKMPKAQTFFEIEEGLTQGKIPELKPLVEMYRESRPDSKPKDVFLFYLAPRPNVKPGTVYDGHEFQIGRTNTHVLSWYWQDIPAEQRSWSDPKLQADVLQAWKFQKARALARQKANEIANNLNEKKLPPEEAQRVLRQVQAEQKLGEPFVLDKVAQLNKPDREPQMVLGQDYTPYRIPEEHSERFAHPPDYLVQELLTLKRPGDALVVADKPERNLYVAVLLHRLEPSIQEFMDVYKRSRPPFADPLYDRFVEEQSRAFLDKVVVQLRRDAGAVDKNGRFVIPEHLRKRSGESTRDYEE